MTQGSSEFFQVLRRFATESTVPNMIALASVLKPEDVIDEKVKQFIIGHSVSLYFGSPTQEGLQALSKLIANVLKPGDVVDERTIRKSVSLFIGSPTQEGMQVLSKLMAEEIIFLEVTKTEIAKRAIALFLANPMQENAIALQNIIEKTKSKIFGVLKIDERLIQGLVKIALGEEPKELFIRLSQSDLDEFKKQLEALPANKNVQKLAKIINAVKPIQRNISRPTAKPKEYKPPAIMEPQALNNAHFIVELNEKDPVIPLKQILFGRKKDGKPFVLDDYKKMSQMLTGLLSPEEIFKSIADFKKEIEDKDDRPKYLNNVEILIRELILADTFHEKFKTFCDYLVQNPEMNKEEMRQHPDEIVRQFYAILQDVYAKTAKSIYATARFTAQSDRVTEVGWRTQAPQQTSRRESRRESISAVMSKSIKKPAERSLSPFLQQSLAGSVTGKEISELAEIVAKDLQLYTMSLFIKVKPSEFHGLVWTKKDKASKSPNLLEMIENFNALSSKVIQDLLFAPTLKHQQNIFSFYLQVFNQSMMLGNYDTAMAISSAFSASPIFRLKYLFDLKESEQKIYDSMKNFGDANGNFKNYRQLLEVESGVPIIPYMGLFLSDLTFAEEGNKDLLLRNLLQGDVLRKVNYFQQSVAEYWDKNLRTSLPVTDIVPLVDKQVEQAKQGMKLTDKELDGLSAAIMPRGEKPYKDLDSLMKEQVDQAKKVNVIIAPRKRLTTSFSIKSEPIKKTSSAKPDKKRDSEHPH